MFFGSVWSKCQVFLSELHTPIVPFLNEIPENYSTKGDFDPMFGKFLNEFQNHPNNIFEFQRYCKSLNDEIAGSYGFAIIEVFDNLEHKPIIHQYFKFNDSDFFNGILLVGNLNGTKYNEKIEIQKISFKNFLAKEPTNSRKYYITKNYVFLIFEHSFKTGWMDVHFDYGEKYVSFQKLDTLIEASVDALVLAENYGIDWLKKLIQKLYIPTFSFQASENNSWTRCCNNWFLSPSSFGSSENSCCSSDLQYLNYKGLPLLYKEPITCKVPGCLLNEGKHVKIRRNNDETFFATVSKMEEKNVTFKYLNNGKENETVLTYEKIFSINSHITVLNYCTIEIPEINDIDELNGTQALSIQNPQNHIIFCYFNETLNKKMCGNFWIGQNITVLDIKQNENVGTITKLFANTNHIFVNVASIDRTFSFNQLKQYNSQMFDQKSCYDNFIASMKLMPLKAINIETFNRSFAMSKILKIGQKINVPFDERDKNKVAENDKGFYTLPSSHSRIGENGTIEKYKIATIIQFSKIFAKVKDDKTEKIFRQPYAQIIDNNPLIFDNLETDKIVELYRVENEKLIFSLIKVNQNISSFDYVGTVYKIYGDIGMVTLDTMEGKVSIPIEDIYYSNTEIIKEKKVLEVCPKFKGKHFNRHQRKKAADCIY